jgi:hypothetical protein
MRKPLKFRAPAEQPLARNHTQIQAIAASAGLKAEMLLRRTIPRSLIMVAGADSALREGTRTALPVKADAVSQVHPRPGTMIGQWKAVAAHPWIEECNRRDKIRQFTYRKTMVAGRNSHRTQTVGPLIVDQLIEDQQIIPQPTGMTGRIRTGLAEVSLRWNCIGLS